MKALHCVALILKGDTMSKVIQNEQAYELATKRAIVRNARKTFDVTFDKDGKIARFLASNTWNSFYKSLFDQLENNGKLSEKQVACVLSGIAKEDAKLESKKIEADNYESIVIGCFTIVKTTTGEFNIWSDKPSAYGLGHWFAKTEKAAIAYCKKQWAAHEKHVKTLNQDN